MKKVSIIAPVYNEEMLIEKFYNRVKAAIQPLNKTYSFEVILIDDGSRDGSLNIMKRLATQDLQLLVIEFRRNYGQTAALQAGLDAASGDIIITMDADLQHFPEEIPDFLAKLEEGFDLVCGWRHKRLEGVARRWPSMVANLIIRQIVDTNIHDFGTTYRAYRYEIAKELRLLGESHRFLPVLVANLGGKITEIPIQNIERSAGKSKYGIGRTFGVLFDLISLQFMTHYSDRPLRAFAKVAVGTFSIGFTILVILVIKAYATGIQAVLQHIGWLMISILFLLTSVEIVLTGILAEFLTQVLYGQDERRVYRIKSKWNVPTPGNQ